jgi:hypothetical protein
VTLDLPKARVYGTAFFGRRSGIVRLDGRVFLDDDGQFAGIGATLFPAVSVYHHDRARLEKNLALLADRVDYVRVLAVVGPSQSWSDRTSDPRQPWWEAAIAGVADLVFDTFGLRVQWTVFGETVATPTRDDRANAVTRLIQAMRGREHKVQLYEVANEGWKNGFEGAEGRREARALAQLLRDRTPNLVAITAPGPGDPAVPEEQRARAEADSWYEGSAAQIATLHLDRDTRGTGGPWRPVRQAREGLNLFSIPWLNNEPIGRFSSVAADADPLRLAMGAAMTWQCAGAGSVYHSGAGIRLGGEWDRNRGLPADFDAIDAQVLDVIGRLRGLLPPDLPNWQWANANRTFAREYPFSNAEELQRITDAGGLLRAFAMSRGGRIVVMPLLATGPTPFTTRAALTLTVHNPLTGDVIDRRELAAGETYMMAPRDAAILIGVPR